MASKLSLTQISVLPNSIKTFPKHAQAIRLLPLLPLNSPSSQYFFKTKAQSTQSFSVSNAVIDQFVESSTSESTQDSRTIPSVPSSSSSPSSSKVVLVVGGTGGVGQDGSLIFFDDSDEYYAINTTKHAGNVFLRVGYGQLVVASLLDRNIKSHLLIRKPEKATALFGEHSEDKLKVFKGDTRNPEDLDPSVFEGVTHVICCTGTTAFPSKRWDGDNTPERTDWEGVRNLVQALPPSVKRFVLVSSVGVTKFNELPWSIMNLFGVLKYKKMGEDFVRDSGLPFTIIRAGRLTDGPYTSYDLNTLLKATAGERRAVVIDQGDKLVGEVSRLVVAEACIQALDIDFTEGQTYEINSVQGEGPGNDTQKWKDLFRAAQKS